MSEDRISPYAPQHILRLVLHRRWPTPEEAETLASRIVAEARGILALPEGETKLLGLYSAGADDVAVDFVLGGLAEGQETVAAAQLAAHIASLGSEAGTAEAELRAEGSLLRKAEVQLHTAGLPPSPLRSDELSGLHSRTVQATSLSLPSPPPAEDPAGATAVSELDEVIQLYAGRLKLDPTTDALLDEAAELSRRRPLRNRRLDFLMERQRQEKAVRKIESRWFERKEQRLQVAASTIQIRFRYKCKVQARQRTKEHRAASKIQAFWRRMRVLMRFKQAVVAMRAAQKVQAWARGCMLRAQLNRAYRARLRLWWLCFLQAMDYQKTKRACRQQAAATKLQAAWRGFLARRELKRRREAVRLQSARVLLVQACFRRQFDVHKLNARWSAAVRIQAAVRGFFARRAARRLRAEVSAALRLQAWWRRCKGMSLPERVREAAQAEKERLQAMEEKARLKADARGQDAADEELKDEEEDQEEYPEEAEARKTYDRRFEAEMRKMEGDDHPRREAPKSEEVDPSAAPNAGGDAAAAAGGDVAADTGNGDGGRKAGDDHSRREAPKPEEVPDAGSDAAAAAGDNVAADTGNAGSGRKTGEQMKGFAFARDRAARNVFVSEDGLQVKHRKPEGDEDFGVVFGDACVPRFAEGCYFEVLVDKAALGGNDGLTLGVATALPSSAEQAQKLETAEQVRNGWSFGFDGRACLCGELRPNENQPPLRCRPPLQNLRQGDRAGLLVRPDGALEVFVNSRSAVRVPTSGVPVDTDLYAFVDLLESARGVSLLLGAPPPPPPAARPEPSAPAVVTPLAFAEGFSSKSIEFSQGCRRAEHLNPDQGDGVLFGSKSAPKFATGASYFELRIEEMDTLYSGDDGLVIGVTTALPNAGFPFEVAEDVPASWSFGYNGKAHFDGDEQLEDISWNPTKCLGNGDHVGLLVSADGVATVYQNGKAVVEDFDGLPAQATFYPVVELCGGAIAASLVPGARPPGVPGPDLTGFDRSIASKLMVISADGLQIERKDPSSTHFGVLLGNGPVPVLSDGATFFEVQVNKTKNDGPDGLTMGVTTEMLKPPPEGYGEAEAVPNSVSVGYDGLFINSATDAEKRVDWRPADLKVNDLVGFHATSDGQGRVLLNGREVAEFSAELLKKRPLYPIVDVQGNTKAVTLLLGATPPPPPVPLAVLGSEAMPAAAGAGVGGGAGAGAAQVPSSLLPAGKGKSAPATAGAGGGAAAAAVEATSAAAAKATAGEVKQVSPPPASASITGQDQAFGGAAATAASMGAEEALDPSVPSFAFAKHLVSEHVSLSRDGKTATHLDPTGELGHAVLFGDAPIPTFPEGSYFEVRIEQSRANRKDGLTLGVTTQLPPSREKANFFDADEVPKSWSVGYDGLMHICGQGPSKIEWNPKDLRLHDRVGLLVTPGGDIRIFVNSRPVLGIAAGVPAPEAAAAAFGKGGVQPLFALVDLLGAAGGVSIWSGARPPAMARCFDNAGQPVLTGFAQGLKGESVLLSADGSRAHHKDPTGATAKGVIFVDRPLPLLPAGKYFEVRVDASRKGNVDDGIAIGVTTTMLEGKDVAKLEAADHIPCSWSFGYSDLAFAVDAQKKVKEAKIRWQSKDLRFGDRVGLLISRAGQAVVYVNGEGVARGPEKVPVHMPLFPFVDLLGNVVSVSVVAGAEPPAGALPTGSDFEVAKAVLSNQVRCDGLSVMHVGTGEFGVVVGDRPLRFSSCGRYFQVVVDSVRTGNMDTGLGIGVTSTTPEALADEDPYDSAPLIPSTWIAGYDGLAEGMFGEIDLKWKPSKLQVGDEVGLWISPFQDFVVFVNGEPKVRERSPKLPNGGFGTLYAVIDLVGRVSGVSLMPNAELPSLQAVHDQEDEEEEAANVKGVAAAKVGKAPLGLLEAVRLAQSSWPVEAQR